MEYNNLYELRQLASLYLEAETTTAQESRLRELLEQENIPAEFRPLAAMMTAFADRSAEVLTVPMTPIAARPLRKMRMRKLYSAISVAAALVIVAGASWKLATPDRQVYCYLNGEPVTIHSVAMRQAEMAGRLLETSVRVSAENLATVESAVQAATSPLRKVEKAISALDTIQKTQN